MLEERGTNQKSLLFSLIGCEVYQMVTSDSSIQGVLVEVGIAVKESHYRRRISAAALPVRFKLINSP